jgi:hypothetical protein
MITFENLQLKCVENRRGDARREGLDWKAPYATLDSIWLMDVDGILHT